MKLSKRKQLAVLTMLLIKKRRLESADFETPKSKRKCWIKSWIKDKKWFGCHSNLLQELRLFDPESYRRYLRMDEDTFKLILSKVHPIIAKQDTRFRKSISSSEKLSITLRHLATGESQWSLALQFRVGQSTISKFIVDVCQAIYSSLRAEYMQVPNSSQQWREIAEEFESSWNFPHCIGAMDGKHIAIRCPPHTGTEYFNYKKFYSVVLLALVDADINFLYVEVGAPGRLSDSGIWANSDFKNAFDANTLNLPAPDKLRGTEDQFPYVIVCDEGFPLTKLTLRPYGVKQLDDQKRIFNYRLSRARRISENAFGILANTWRILHTTILTSPSRVENMLLAICTLHNMLRQRKSTRSYITPAGSLDLEDISTCTVMEGTWRRELSNNLTRLNAVSKQRFTTSAVEIRDKFKTYFNSFGSIYWQNNVLNT